jgi:hypothetical protein
MRCKPGQISRDLFADQAKHDFNRAPTVVSSRIDSLSRHLRPPIHDRANVRHVPKGDLPLSVLRNILGTTMGSLDWSLIEPRGLSGASQNPSVSMMRPENRPASAFQTYQAPELVSF